MNPAIRRMTLDDLVQVIAIDRASFSLPWPERSFRFEITDNPAGWCWVAELDDQVVGTLVLWLIMDVAHIASIATHPDFRRQGIGRALLIHALAAAEEQGARSAHLEVRAGNLSAQDLYRRFGFAEIARMPRYYKDNGEDAVVMALPELRAEALTGGGGTG
jgi:ribosomal-protein-alanine N-acetyltransferase